MPSVVGFFFFVPKNFCYLKVTWKFLWFPMPSTIGGVPKNTDPAVTASSVKSFCDLLWEMTFAGTAEDIYLADLFRSTSATNSAKLTLLCAVEPCPCFGSFSTLSSLLPSMLWLAQGCCSLVQGCPQCPRVCPNWIWAPWAGIALGRVGVQWDRTRISVRAAHALRALFILHVAWK